MNLKQIRSRNFDDILYNGIRNVLQKNKAKPVELFKTDEAFLRATNELFAEIEKEHITLFRPEKKTGFSTALTFIVAYYSLHYDKITILQKPGANFAILQPVFSMFAEFAEFNFKIERKTNQAYVRFENDIICKINLLNDNAFDIVNVEGLVIFDNCVKLKNIDKFTDLLKNKEKYDKIILNFPQTPEIDKLAVDYNLKIKEIKILNE